MSAHASTNEPSSTEATLLPRGRARHTLKRLMSIVLALLALFAFALGIWALIPASTPAFRDASGKTVEGSIASMEMVEIGGLKQFLLLRGRDRNAPVLLYLHGGPGSPEVGLMRARLSALEDHFVVAYWDQRGGGRSYSAEAHRGGLDPETVVGDTHEVVELLRRRFEREKIVLLGISWGSYLGMREVAAHPEGVAAFVGAGQLTHWGKNEAASYAKVLADAEAAGNEEAVQELEAIGPPQDGRYRDGFAGLRTERRWVMKLGGTSRSAELSELTIARQLLFPSEYSLLDTIGWIRGAKASLSMVESVTADQAPDLYRWASTVDAPVFLVAGRYDGQTPLAVVEEYYEHLQAPTKELIVFEDSAHLAPFEENERFVRFMTEKVLPLGKAR